MDAKAYFLTTHDVVYTSTAVAFSLDVDTATYIGKLATLTRSLFSDCLYHTSTVHRGRIKSILYLKRTHIIPAENIINFPHTSNNIHAFNVLLNAIMITTKSRKQLAGCKNV